jgi:microcompartment protein CcmK/EutM
MLLGRVIGTVWATRKDPKVAGMKWLIVRALKLDKRPLEAFVVAVDAVGAGLGETVLVTQGSSARQTELTANKPVDAVIVAIVDGVEVADKQDWAAFDRRAVADLAGPSHGA